MKKDNLPLQKAARDKIIHRKKWVCIYLHMLCFMQMSYIFKIIYPMINMKKEDLKNVLKWTKTKN